MKNSEKFKTPEEAYRAYLDYCVGHTKCSDCKYVFFDADGLTCAWGWLFDEAEEPPQWKENITNKFTRKD